MLGRTVRLAYALPVARPLLSIGRAFGTLGEEVMTFGKFRGQTFAAVVNNDPQYCEFVLRKSKMDDAGAQLLAFAKWLEDNGHGDLLTAEKARPKSSSAEDQTLVGFGKYRASTYADLLAKDPAYCEWVVRSAEDDSLPTMRAFKRWLQSKQ
jgi:hypothetical protein